MSYAYPSVDAFTQDFVREGLITRAQLAVAMVSKKNLGEDLGTILVKKKFVTEGRLLKFLSKHLNIPFIPLKEQKLDSSLLREISVSIAKRHGVLPLCRRGDVIEIAIANPLDTQAMDDVKAAFHSQNIVPFLASPQELEEKIDEVYQTPVTIDEEKKTVELESMSDVGDLGTAGQEKIQEIASGPKVISAVNNLISQAWSGGASDIHIEPFREECRVRMRIDGLLQERNVYSRNVYFAVVSRIKIMAGLDIAEHRVPQDGRIRMRMVGRTLDLRVSTCPTQYGEKVVLRLLAKEALRSVEDLGMREEDRKIFSELVGKRHGIFLVCGPTGSGKSTTLYSALLRINNPELNIVSIEDPIENEIAGVSQIAVNAKAGLIFAGILRSVLRQDPDVIMLGEIRDAETAHIAIRAAITGHMVLSTLHTNTAAGAVARLLDLEVEPFLLSTALRGIVAQRLVRKICPHCQEELKLTPEILGPYAKIVHRAFRGKGCVRCHLTGYQGRIGIFDIAPINEAIRKMIYQRSPESDIEREIRKIHPVTLTQDGFLKVAQGMTTLEEILRVTEEQ